MTLLRNFQLDSHRLLKKSPKSVLVQMGINYPIEHILSYQDYPATWFLETCYGGYGDADNNGR